MADSGRANLALIDRLRRELAAAADPERAVKQQAYMKSALPYYGVGVPQVRQTARRALRDFPIAGPDELEATVRALFDDATHREEWYAALELWAASRHARFRTPRLLPLLEHVVLTSQWWDVVDDVATHVFGPTLREYRVALTPVAEQWADHHNLWLRRTALLSQVGAKADVDLVLLDRVLQPNLRRNEFFLRKAVGWALRDAARYAPDWVRSYLSRHAAALSPLSLKEASRHL